MKKLLLKTLCWIIPIIVLHLFLGTFAGGNTDGFYRRFTTPKQSNLVLGNSRSAQGIQPKFLKGKNGEQFYNFSFTIFDSPYGEAYMNAIQQKLKGETKDGNFVVTVDPWSISNRKQDLDVQPEKNGMLGKQMFFNIKPNYNYLLNNYHKSWFALYQTRDSKYKSKMYLNDDGWLEINITFDSAAEYERNVEEKLSAYRLQAKEFGISQRRINDLNKTISLLKQHGEVLLVRLPQSSKMQEIENGYVPEFNKIIESVAANQRVKYIDFSKNGDKYHYLDGNHLQKESGKEFTKILNDSLQLYFK